MQTEHLVPFKDLIAFKALKYYPNNEFQQR